MAATPRETATPPPDLGEAKVLCDIVRHASWSIIAMFPQLSKQCLALSKQDSHWHLLARCLSDEFGLFVPEIAGFVDRGLFLELWATRHLFCAPPPPVDSGAAIVDAPAAPDLALTADIDDEAAIAAAMAQLKSEVAVEDAEPVEEPTELSLTVCCRFRPEVADAGGDTTATKVVVPLHQRTQQVQASRGVSRKVALRMIMSNQLPQPDIPFKDSKDAAASEEGGLGQNAQKAGVMQLETTAPKGDVLAMVPGVGLRSFHFSKVFDEKEPQGSIFDGAAARVVMDFVNGLSGSAIVYGQTGSGKTHTMFGDDGAESSGGIVPRSFDMVLGAVKERRAAGVVDLNLTMSYVEIYGDEIRNLLNGGKIVGQGQEGRHADTRATDRVGHRYVLDGQEDVVVEDMRQVGELLRRGDGQKRRSATAMNEHSTRAHTVIVLSLVQRIEGSGSERVIESKLFLADLGGSEKISKSGANDMSKPKVRFFSIHCMPILLNPLLSMLTIHCSPGHARSKPGRARHGRRRGCEARLGRR